MIPFIENRFESSDNRDIRNDDKRLFIPRNRELEELDPRRFQKRKILSSILLLNQCPTQL